MREQRLRDKNGNLLGRPLGEPGSRFAGVWLYSLAEELEAVRPPGWWEDWLPWELDAARGVLVYRGPGCEYEVDLESCTSSAAVLDWIMQIEGKRWGDRVIAGLVRAIRDILRPQANLCSWEQDLRITSGQAMALVREQERKRAESVRVYAQ